MRSTTRRTLLGGGALVVLLAGVCADARMMSAKTEMAIVAAAESAGALFPRAVAGTETQQHLPRWDSGTAERRCVEANRPTRSGEFVGARFEVDQFWGPAQVKLAPAYPSVAQGRLLPAKVIATRLNVRRHVREFELTSTGSTEPWFYASDLDDVPWFGRWMVVVTAGQNWGCFLYTL